MRVFKDIEMVEQLGTGIIRILKIYDRDVYEFSDNFIRVNFKYRTSKLLPKTPRNININTNKSYISETQRSILKLIAENKQITQSEISDNLRIDKSTVVRNIKTLKEKNILRRVGSDKNGQWEIL